GNLGVGGSRLRRAGLVAGGRRERERIKREPGHDPRLARVRDVLLRGIPGVQPAGLVGERRAAGQVKDLAVPAAAVLLARLVQPLDRRFDAEREMVEEALPKELLAGVASGVLARPRLPERDRRARQKKDADPSHHGNSPSVSPRTAQGKARSQT